jgi:hypothetical protein
MDFKVIECPEEYWPTQDRDPLVEGDCPPEDTIWIRDWRPTGSNQVSWPFPPAEIATKVGRSHNYWIWINWTGAKSHSIYKWNRKRKAWVSIPEFLQQDKPTINGYQAYSFSLVQAIALLIKLEREGPSKCVI